MAIGFSDGKYYRPSLSTLIQNLETQYQKAINNPKFSIEDDENIGQLLKLNAYAMNQVYQTQQQGFNAWIFNGLEGESMDETFALNGVFREPATAGVGDVVIQTDRTAGDTESIAVGSIFSANNSGQYAATSTTLLSSKVTALKINGKTTPLNTYQLQVTDNLSSVVKVEDFTLASNTDENILNFLNSIKEFLESINTEETSVYIDETNLVLYWGFDSAYELKGLTSNYRYLATPTLGNKYSLVEVANIKTGFNPLPVDSIKSVSNPPLGYISVTNLKPFSSGSEIESDAAFMERAISESNSPRSSTATAIVSALYRDVPSIDAVKIDKQIVDGQKVITPIIIGGETADIAKVLYDTQSISTFFSGNVSYTITDTLDGTPETIKFQRGEVTQASIRVTYKAVNDVALSSNEVATAKSNLISTADTWKIGNKIFNYSLTSAVANATSYNRFENLVVEIKRLEDPESSYTNLNFTPSFDELLELEDINIEFLQEL